MTAKATCVINVSLEQGNVLSAEITPDDGVRPGDQFFFYVLRYGAAEYRSSGWSAENAFKYDLPSSGIYSIQGHLKRDGVNSIFYSRSLLFLDDEDRAGFERFRADNDLDAGAPAEDDLFLAAKPYHDFIVISGTGRPDLGAAIEGFARNYGLSNTACGRSGANRILSTHQGLNSRVSRMHLFSGSCFYQGRLWVGDEEISDLDAIKNDEPTGSYTYLLETGDAGELVIGSDYFGIQKLFFMETDGLALVSNNYHLLILFAKAARLSIKVDEEKAVAALLFSAPQPFQQSLSRRMDIHPAEMMSPHKRIHVRDGSLRLSDTSLASALENPPSYEADDYLRLLSAAREEILSNVKAILSHPAYKHAIVDLTGGMDSRIVFAAVTNFPEHSGKIRLNSLHTAGFPDDLAVAQEVASLYNYEYDDLPRLRRPLPGKSAAGAIWSYNLGNYYSYNAAVNLDQVREACRIVGFYGEICARPYYSRHLLKTDLDVNSVGEFCDKYFDRYQRSFISGLQSDIEAKKSLFKEELERIPGRTPLERLENHYLFFRNGLHCSDRLRSSAGWPEFGPIQSKSLFAAKVMSYRVFSGPKVQYDIIDLLNPVIANVRYESSADNSDRIKAQTEFGGVCAPWAKGLQVIAGDASNRWEEARKRIKVTRQHPANPAPSPHKFDDFAREAALSSLRLASGVTNSEDLVEAIWLILSKTDDPGITRSMRNNVINRVVSLGMQCQIASA